MAKIKVLHIVTSLCVGGIERMVVSVCNDLNKNQFDVTLLVLSDNENTLKGQLNSDVQLIELDSVKTSSGIKEIMRLFCQRSKIETLINKVTPDIIHTHIFFYTVVPLLIAMRKVVPKSRHFHTVHTSGLHYASDKRSAKIRCEEWWFKKNDTTVICVSKEVQRRVVKLMPNILTCVIPNYVGFQVKKQIVQRPTIESSETIIIVYLARLAEGKNHRRLIEAFAILVENYPNAKLRLIGDGMLGVDLKQLVSDFGIDQNIEFCGHSNQIQELLQQCDVGVFPSEYEGFSVALVEMMSVGLPMACSDINNFRDLSMHDKDMLYFDPYNDQDIARTLQSIIEDSDLRAKLAAASINISNNYTKEKIIQQYEQVYETSRCKI